MKRWFLSFFVLLLIFSLPTFTGAYAGGLLNGKALNIFTSSGKTTTALTDNDESTTFNLTGSSNWQVGHSFSQPISIEGYYIKTVTPTSSFHTITFYDANNKQLKSINSMSPNAIRYFPQVDNVSRVVLSNGTYASDFIVQEFDIFEVRDREPPATPTGLTYTPGVGQVDLNWNANTESDLAGYRIYKNGALVNTNALVTKNTYTLADLPADVNYAIQVSAVDRSGNESPKSQTLNISAWSQIEKPVLSATSVADNRVRLEWTGAGNSYDVYQDGTKLVSTIYKFLDVTKLTPATTYKFKVVQTDRYGRVSESDVLSVKTTEPKLSPPVMSIGDVTHNSFRVSWQPVDFAKRYSVLIDGELATTTDTDFSYTATSLSPSTIYSVTVRAENDVDQKESTLSTTTLKKPVPEITSASVSRVPGDTSKRALSYSTNGHVTAVKVYLDGKFVGEYPVSQESIELDASTLTGLIGNVRIEPVDEDGVPYEFGFPAKTTGNEDVDDFLSDWLNGFNLSSSAFKYLAIASIPLLILVALFFWLRFKYQGMFGKTANQKGEQKDSKGAAIRQANKDKFDPEPPKTLRVKGKRKPFKPWEQMTEKERSDWKDSKGIKESPQRFRTSAGGGASPVNQLISAMNDMGKKDYQQKLSRSRGNGFKPKGNSSASARASPKQTQSYKGKTYQLGKRGDYKPFGNQGRKYR